MSETSHWLKGSKPSEAPGRHNPKIHGHIPGNPPGTTYNDREELSSKGVHAPIQAGIHGNKQDGAYSVVMSYGYEDDEDNGYSFIYTGHGGRRAKLSPTEKRLGKESWDTSEQYKDQEWTFGNGALKLSCKTGNPVRVIRGAPRKNETNVNILRYAPPTGYRYDGLYVVVKAWKEKGLQGFNVCRFLFERQLGQKSLSEIIPGAHSPMQRPVSSTPGPAAGPSKPPRRAHDPLPPYKPTEEQLAKLRRSELKLAGSASGTSKPPQRPPREPRPPYKPTAEQLAKLGRSQPKLVSSASLNVAGTSRAPLPDFRPSDEEASRTKHGNGASSGLTLSKSAMHYRKRSLSIVDSVQGEDTATQLNQLTSKGPVPTETPVDSDSDWDWGGVQGNGKQAPAKSSFKKRKMDDKTEN